VAVIGQHLRRALLAQRLIVDKFANGEREQEKDGRKESPRI
jgi:hypothetical protein